MTEYVCLINNFVWCIYIYMQNKSWKNFFAYLGPGFLVSIAYIDPGNCKIINQIHFPISFSLTIRWLMLFLLFFMCFAVETDLQAGAQYKYEVHKLFPYSPYLFDKININFFVLNSYFGSYWWLLVRVWWFNLWLPILVLSQVMLLFGYKFLYINFAEFILVIWSQENI